MNLKERIKQLKRDIPTIFLALKKKETPVMTKVLAGITIAYVLSPIDLIPDFIPVLGYLDDLLIVPMLVALTIKLIPKEELEICRRDAEGMWEKGTPKKWYYAIGIVLIWALVIGLILRAIW